ncbi:MAG TPA: helix-turn-helix domain-containing protein [Stellaceae bacterium]
MDRAASIGIGELSRRAKCKIETIRYYERIGLIPAPARTASRYRLYDGTDVRRLMFVRRARELGFSIDAVRALLQLAGLGADACVEARALAADHLTDVQGRIADLKRMQRALTQAIRQCDEGKSATSCPLIEALSSDAGDARRPAPEGV